MTASAASPYDAAIELAEQNLEWIDWGNETEIREKKICSALAWMGGFKNDVVVSEMEKFLLQELERDDEHDEFHRRVFMEFAKIELRSTEFILNNDISVSEVMEKFNYYRHIRSVISTVKFLLLPKPCCRLSSLAFMIPITTASPSCLRLVAYAANHLATFMNDPTDPFQPDCFPVGNSWFHRLGIFLLNQCTAQNIAPPPDLVQLLSQVTSPPTQSVKGGKAEQMLDILQHEERPTFLHESPPEISIGNYLALELLGEFEPNRQFEHFRRIEKAVFLYAKRYLDEGKPPSTNSLHKFSKLSWPDAQALPQRPFFKRLCLEQQCRILWYFMKKSECTTCGDPIMKSEAADE